MNTSVCIIPARMGSSRFPGKPLKTLLGMPLILHIRTLQTHHGLDRVIVATCDEEIHQAVIRHGEVCYDVRYPNSAQIEQKRQLKLKLNLDDDDFVLMVQGDEALVSPAMLSKMSDIYFAINFRR